MDTTPITIFRAGIKDAALVRVAMSDIHDRRSNEKAAIDKFLADPACYFLLAKKSDEIVGALNGYMLRHPHRKEPQFLLYEVDVRSKFHNQGIGKKLVNAFTAEARKMGAYEIWVLTNNSNLAALSMYMKCGYTRPNQDDVMLSLQLVKS